MTQYSEVEVLVVYWEWTEGDHKGSGFWACHATANDGRIDDWPSRGMKATAAAKVMVVEGQGLELLKQAGRT